eukprot:2988965-Rhodomonas_salina.2
MSAPDITTRPNVQDRTSSCFRVGSQSRRLKLTPISLMSELLCCCWSRLRTPKQHPGTAVGYVSTGDVIARA